MSHSVTIQTRTVTTGGSSPVNTGFCRTWTGMLKIAQVVIGLIVMSLLLAGTYNTLQVLGISYHIHSLTPSTAYLLVVSSAFMISTAIHVVSRVFSSTVTEMVIGKFDYLQEIIYNASAVLLIVTASIAVVAGSIKNDTIIAGGAFGFIDAILHGGNLALVIMKKA